MKGQRRSKRLLSQKLLSDSSQENKGEALHVDDEEDDEEEDVDVDHARPRKSATTGTFSLTDLNRLALKPGLTVTELANGLWNLQGRLEAYDPEHYEPSDTFVKNIILGRNLEVFLEVDKSLSLGKGMILQLMFAAVRVGDEDAVVRLVSLLHRRRATWLFSQLRMVLEDYPLDKYPPSGVRALVKEIVRLKIVKPGSEAVTTTYTCKDFIENFRVLRCSKQALIAVDEVLGPQVWDEIRKNEAIAVEIEDEGIVRYARLACSGVLEFLLRHNALVLTPILYFEISTFARRPALYKHSPHILSLIDYYIEAGYPILEDEDEEEPKVFIRICSNIDYGEVVQLHNLLEFCVPAESSCTLREDGLLNEPRPPPHIVKKRSEMVFDALCKRGMYLPMRMHAGLPLQHYLFHELQLDIGQGSKYCNFRVIFLGPTSPPTLVDKVLHIVQANVPKLDMDAWKELFKHDVYPVPAYYGDQTRKGAQSSFADKMDIFRKSLGYYRANTNPYLAYEVSSWARTHETLEYLRPWFRVVSEALSKETKFSMKEAMEVCSMSDFRAQVMVEADMIRVSDELRPEWRQKKMTDCFPPYLSKYLFPIYSKWYEYTQNKKKKHAKDQELLQVLLVYLFATACATNRLSEAKRVLLDMLQPPSGQEPCAQVSSRRANLLTMAACTGNLSFVKWVLAQIQAAFPLEPNEKLKDLGHVSGPDRTTIEWRDHQLTIPAWLDFMIALIFVDKERCKWWNPRQDGLFDPFLCITDRILDPSCPKHLMDIGLLLAQTDPLAVLPLILRISIMKQQRLQVWTGGVKFYDSPVEGGDVDDRDNDDDGNDVDDNDDEVWKRDLYGTNPAWAWGPITLVKLIELIADETTGTADTILSAEEQSERIGVEGSRAFCLTKSGGTGR